MDGRALEHALDGEGLVRLGLDALGQLRDALEEREELLAQPRPVDSETSRSADNPPMSTATCFMP